MVRVCRSVGVGGQTGVVVVGGGGSTQSHPGRG
jgi:hypothetical protein